MKATFVTVGWVEKITPENKPAYFKVGRKGMCPITLSQDIPEYHEAGRHIHIDGWGCPWIKSRTGEIT